MSYTMYQFEKFILNKDNKYITRKNIITFPAGLLEGFRLLKFFQNLGYISYRETSKGFKLLAYEEDDKVIVRDKKIIFVDFPLTYIEIYRMILYIAINSDSRLVLLKKNDKDDAKIKYFTSRTNKAKIEKSIILDDDIISVVHSFVLANNLSKYILITHNELFNSGIIKNVFIESDMLQNKLKKTEILKVLSDYDD